MALPGFDPEFADIPDYIIKITERIWEGRGIGLIRDWYAKDCIVRGSGGPSVGVERVVSATVDTLRVLPGRRLLAEDIIWSEDAPGAYLSSHRVIGPGRHFGDGPLGPPTGRPIVTRAIADCLCIGNQIVEEWLVRDAGALVKQIGGDVAEVAARQAARDEAAGIAPWQAEPAARLRAEGAFMPPVLHDHPAARLARDTWASIWHADLNVVADRYHPACNFHTPGHLTEYGHEGVWTTMFSYLSAFPDARVVIEHSIAREDPGLPVRTATRWWLTGTHTGPGRFGPPSGATVLILGINHANVVNGRIHEEWMVVDELAVQVQIARARG